MSNLSEKRFVRLLEDMAAGGEGSAFGPGVDSTADQFSGDNYALGDARNLFGSGKKPVMQTRPGLKSKCRKKKKKCGKRKRK